MSVFFILFINFAFPCLTFALKLFGRNATFLIMLKTNKQFAYLPAYTKHVWDVIKMWYQ